MSLINDALKKVSEADRGKAHSQGQGPTVAQPDFETRAMQPVVYQSRPSPVLWISIMLFIGAVGVAGFVYAKTRSTHAPVAVQATPAAETKPVAATIVAAEPVEQQPKAPEPISAASATSNAIANATPAPVAPAALTPAQPAPAPVVVPVGPIFRLKGILYTKNPTALINDASVQAGGEVDGATVTQIDATSVTLQINGKTKVLKLGAKE
jgi:hypothetical protein